MPATNHLVRAGWKAENLPCDSRETVAQKTHKFHGSNARKWTKYLLVNFIKSKTYLYLNYNHVPMEWFLILIAAVISSADVCLKLQFLSKI